MEPAARAFLRGRVQLALQPVMPIAALTYLSWRLGKPVATVALCSSVVLAASCLAFFWGQGFRRGAIVGLRAGAISFFAPVLAGHNHCQVGGRCVAYCLLACLAAGFLSGAYAGWTLARFQKQRREALLMSSITCVGTSFLGCSMAGASTLYSLIFGFFVGSLSLGLAMQIGKRS